jgi:DNA-binding NtrC family response regulator
MLQGEPSRVQRLDKSTETERRKPMSNSDKRVFILDDEVVVASTLAMILRSQGIDTTSFSEPLKALEAARSRAPNLLISDISMPTISGIDLAIQVQKEFPGCKVLLFSGRADSREMLRAAGASGQAYHILAKPVYPSELLKRIRSMLDVEHPFGANYH